MLANRIKPQNSPKNSKNPVASLISFPLQSNFDFRIGPSDGGWRYTLNIQPVIPISIGSDWNLIVRTIIPYIHQEDVFKGPARIFEEDIDGVPVEVTRGPRPLGHVLPMVRSAWQSYSYACAIHIHFRPMSQRRASNQSLQPTRLRRAGAATGFDFMRELSMLRDLAPVSGG